MRVKPPPGTYMVKVGGATYPVIVTAQGAATSFWHFGAEWTMEWEWFELPPDGPVLQPGGGLAVQYVGFNPDGTVDVVYPDGSGKQGTYEPV